MNMTKLKSHRVSDEYKQFIDDIYNTEYLIEIQYGDNTYCCRDLNFKKSNIYKYIISANLEKLYLCDFNQINQIRKELNKRCSVFKQYDFSFFTYLLYSENVVFYGTIIDFLNAKRN